MFVINNTPFVLVINGKSGLTKIGFGTSDFSKADNGIKEDIKEYMTNPNATGHEYIERGELVFKDTTVLDYNTLEFNVFKEAMEVTMDKDALNKILIELTSNERKKVVTKQLEYIQKTEKTNKKNIREALEVTE